MDFYRKTFAEIDIRNLGHNIEQIQKKFPDAPYFCPMVKANAYGHGDIIVGQHLEALKIPHLGVCLIEEGLRLRAAGIKTDIMVFRGFDQIGARKMIQEKLTPLVSTWEQLEALQHEAIQPIEIHLKFDTGMNRLGFKPDEVEKVLSKMKQLSKLKVVAVATHLFNGEDAHLSNGNSAKQFKLIDQIAEHWGKDIFIHALNSAGMMGALERKSKSDSSLLKYGIRPGLMIYGYNPCPEFQHLNLKPVMKLRSQVSHFRQLKKDDVVSYNGTWKAEKDSIIAVVPIGYADGYHRLLSNRSKALFMGKRVPVIGNVCMDFLMLDVTEVLSATDIASHREKEVVFFGYDEKGCFLSATELANSAQTITWEVLTSVGERVPRITIGSL